MPTQKELKGQEIAKVVTRGNVDYLLRLTIYRSALKQARDLLSTSIPGWRDMQGPRSDEEEAELCSVMETLDRWEDAIQKRQDEQINSIMAVLASPPPPMSWCEHCKSYHYPGFCIKKD